MTPAVAVWVVIALAILAANLPFVNDRVFFAGPRQAPRKGTGWRLVELGVYGAVVVGVGRMLEASLGQAQPQGWQFYAVMACVFLTLAFPGFVWRYLRRTRGG